MTRYSFSLTPAQLKAWRQVHRYSQQRLAIALAISERTIAGWEQGRFNPPPFLPLALQALVDGHELRHTQVGD